jgi:hypothetical protein
MDFENYFVVFVDDVLGKTENVESPARFGILLASG